MPLKDFIKSGQLKDLIGNGETRMMTWLKFAGNLPTAALNNKQTIFNIGATSLIVYQNRSGLYDTYSDYIQSPESQAAIWEGFKNFLYSYMYSTGTHGPAAATTRTSTAATTIKPQGTGISNDKLNEILEFMLYVKKSGDEKENKDITDIFADLLKNNCKFNISYKTSQHDFDENYMIHFDSPTEDWKNIKIDDFDEKCVKDEIDFDEDFWYKSAVDNFIIKRAFQSYFATLPKPEDNTI